MAYVMIVDDDEDFASAAAARLRDAGHEVGIELTVAGAKVSMGERPPDLAIIDVMFPNDISGGFGLARWMRRHEAHLRSVPILMLTAVNQVFPFGFGESDAGSDSLPVSDFQEKSGDLDALLGKVSALLGQAGTDATGEGDQTS